LSQEKKRSFKKNDINIFLLSVSENIKYQKFLTAKKLKILKASSGGFLILDK